MKFLVTGSSTSLRWCCRIGQGTSDDPRVPEALHYFVRARRYGCVDKSIHSYSRRVFSLLHRRYPESEWTKKTTYWFG